MTQPPQNNPVYNTPAYSNPTYSNPAYSNPTYNNPAFSNQQAPVGANPMQPARKSSGFAIAGLILAIVGILGSWIPFFNYVALCIAILGLIFGIVGLVLASKGTHEGKGLAIAAVIVSVFALIIAIISSVFYSIVIDEANREIQQEIQQGADNFDDEMDKMSGDATEDILANSLDVEIGTFEAVDDGYGWWDTKLPVTLTNKLDEAKSFSITVEAADAEGNRIDTDIVLVSKLGPGQSYSEDIFTFISDDEIERYRNATFTVIEATESDY